MEIQDSDRIGWLNRGKILASLGKHQDALVCYERAMNVKPNYYYYQLWNAISLMEDLLECIELAESDFDRALETCQGKATQGVKNHYIRYIPIPSQDLASFCYNHACFQALQGNVRQSVAYLEQAIQLEGDKYRAKSQQDSDFDGIRNSQHFQNLI